MENDQLINKWVAGNLLSSSSTEERALCQACLQFKLTPNSFTSDSYAENRMHQLGSFQEVYDRTTCPLCQLIVEAYENGPLPYGPRSLASWTKDLRVQGCWQQSSPDGSTSSLRVWLIQFHEERKAALLLRPLATRDFTNPQFAKRVMGPLVNFEVAKGWLKDCEDNHTCEPAYGPDDGPSPPSFRVIDVRNLCIVEHEPGIRYFTLSYVWGIKKLFVTTKANLLELSQPGGLKVHWEALSPVIRDAITLTHKLGESYLWVDSLCIVQDGGKEILDAIHAMDLVYSHAAAMICAADDRSPDVGLPGVVRMRKPKQYISNILPDLTFVAQHDLLAFVDSSNYATRGWTYQEEQLATRIFYLVNDQIYFSCLENIYSEDVVSPISSSNYLSLFMRINARTLTVGSNLATSVRYFHAVSEYTSRNLSYPKDILNAFDGVLKRQSGAFRTRTHYGLPTCFFDLSLLWQPTEQMERRPGFPSWSWAGWSGPVRWLGDTMELSGNGLFAQRTLELEVVTKWHVKHTWIPWRRYDNGDFCWEPSSITDDPTGDNDIGYRAIFSTSDNPYGRSREADINGISSRNSDKTSQNPEQQLSATSTNVNTDALLRFSTLMACYRIRPSGSYLKYGSMDPNWEAKERVVFHIINLHGEVSGYVLLDQRWVATYNRSPEAEYEFIMLSDANYECQWARPHDCHPYTKSFAVSPYIEYHAMMIRSYPEGFSERVGLGRIHQEALKDAWSDGPSWKEIILG